MKLLTTEQLISFPASPFSAMDSNEVIKATQALQISNFLGVFAADQLCGIKKQPGWDSDC